MSRSRNALDAFDRLDAALCRTGGSRIELCLAKVPRAYRPTLLSWLLSLELAARRDRGEQPVESEYLERFPTHTLIVRAAFHGALATSETTAFAQTAGPPVRPRRFLSPSSQDDRYTIGPTPADSVQIDGATQSHQSGSSTQSGFWSLERRSRYSLSSFHKAGGLGEVWRARDHQFGREVALKRIKEDRVTHAPTRARFLREAWITGQLQHPGIAPVFELGSLPGVEEPFYTMRFVEGPTLSAAVADYHSRRKERATGPLELRKLLGSFVSACQVVAYAHSRGVIHRDLKGQNIVLGDFGEVIVLDWGLAKVMADTASKTREQPTDTAPTVVAPPSGSWDETVDGSILGTPAYMSPEQALGRIEQLDERSDVYGMGAILYEVLTAVPPFRGEPAEVLKKVTDDLPARPRQVVHDVPQALEAICLKCLAKDPCDRYPSAIALAEEIQRFLAGEPVSAHRESWKDKARRWASRHRTLVTATLATSLAATACLAAATGLLRIANAREAEARTQAEQRLSLTLRRPIGSSREWPMPPA